jgi:hypothetical protein
MGDILFICRCLPYNYFFVTPDLNKAVAWAKRNRDSTGELQIKRVRWNMLKDSKVIEFKPKEIDVMADIKYLQGGGKEPPADGDWLSLLEIGTIFLVQKKQNTGEFALGKFMLVEKWTDVPKAVFVVDSTGTNHVWNPVRFCNQYMHYKTLGIVNLPQEEEVKDDEDNRDEPSAPTDVQSS